MARRTTPPTKPAKTGGKVELKDVPESDLRILGTELEIQDSDTLALDELLKLIQEKQGAGRLAYLAGVVTRGGEVIELKDMNEAELRKLAADMEIAGHDTLAIDELAKRIADEDVEVGIGYRVNRERLDHDGETYVFGDPIHFDDLAQAVSLLQIGAIVEGV